MEYYAKIYEKFAMSKPLVIKFREIYAIIAIEKKLSYKRGSLSRLNSGNKALLIQFFTAVVKGAA